MIFSQKNFKPIKKNYTASLSLEPFPTKSLWGNLNSSKLFHSAMHSGNQAHKELAFKTKYWKYLEISRRAKPTKASPRRSLKRI